MEEREDILAPYAGRISYGALLKLREKRGREHIWIDPWDELRGLLSFLPRIQAKSVCLDSDIVSIGDRSEVSQDVIDIIEKCICALIPWRKGPYSLFGRVIDSEWRSDLKWNRIEPFLDDPHEKKVADIGGNNGYFLFRMANYSPKLMVNFDPNGRFYYQFELLHRFSGVDNMQHEVLGVEDVHLFENFFDIVLFMGVIYHCRDPLGALRQVYTCLKPGGQMIFESLALPGRKPVSLTPPGRYGKMRNAWFIPTVPCMEAWAQKVGFVHTEAVSVVKLSGAEQRKTQLCPYESLEDFLDPACPNKTVEGYPAPLRAVVVARKRT